MTDEVGHIDNKQGCVLLKLFAKILFTNKFLCMVQTFAAVLLARLARETAATPFNEQFM